MQFTDTDLFLDDFKTLINTDSASGFRPGVEAVARFFRDRFARIGMTAQIVLPGGGQTPCLSAAIGTAPYDLMCLGHMDTVFPRGEAGKRPFEIKDNRAFGPGVCDMKGGLLVVLHALETLHRSGELEQMSVCVAFNGDEETGSADSRDWILDNARNSRQVLVFEPCRPGYHMVTQRKGGGWFHVSVTGKEAHAGADPDKGVNAVVELAHLISAIHGLNDHDRGTSAQVTVIRGGDKINIIPSQARASVDVRILRASEKNRIETFFRELPARRLFPDSEIRVTGRIDRPPMEATPGSRALRDMITAQAAEMGITMNAISTGGCSDGNSTASLGVPTVDGLGIVGGNSHRPDEYAQIDSIPVMTSLLVRVCRKLSNR